MRAKVTIGIPTYNRARFLHESIQSALNQTFTDFELIVSDNASTDNTPEVVNSFNDPRIRYCRQPTNIGLAANYRFVTARADSEFVAILPDDDLFMPDHLASAMTGLATYPNAAYYTSALDRFGDSATNIWYPAAITDTGTPLIYFAPQKAVDFLGIENPGFFNSLVCRKDRFKDNLFWGTGGFVHTDVLILTQLMIQGGCVYANRPTVRYRCHEENISLPRKDKNSAQRLHYMLRHTVRYLAQLLVDTATCTPSDIETHGLSVLPEYAARLVLSLASFYSSPILIRIAKRVFRIRTDLDQISSSCRLARQLGFTVIPFIEQLALLRYGWRP